MEEVGQPVVAEKEKQVIQKAYRDYLAARDLRPRSGQRHMIAEIARYLSSVTMDGDGKRESDPASCVIEAGTGTGKTLSYLLASIPFAHSLKKNIVISTATVTLQQQIIDRELPQLKAHTDLEFRVALAKGRGRYLCLHKIDLLMGEQDQGLLPLSEELPTTESPDYTQEVYQTFLNWMVDKGWEGDWDSVPEPVEEDLWRKVTTDHRQCLVKRCGYFSQCPYYKNKAVAEQAQVIVANHDLVFSDLALGGGYVLPPPEQTIYIFDEAHHLADKAIGHFAFSAGLKSSQKTLKSLSRTLADGQISWGHDDKIGDCIPGISTASIELHQILEALYQSFSQSAEWQSDGDSAWQSQSSLNLYRYPMGQVPSEILQLAEDCSKRVSDVSRDVQTVTRRLRELVDKETQGSLARQTIEQSLMAMSVFESQVSNLDEVWRQFCRVEEESSVPVARWLTTIDDSGPGDITVHVSPTNAAGLLRHRLWSRAFATILTSATLSVGGNFRRLAMQTGLPEPSVFSIHQSPFDFANRSALELCDIGEDPSDRDSYLDKLAAGLVEIIQPEQSTLVLFSARRHMQYIARKLEDHFGSGFILQQGGSNKFQLLEEHRQRIDRAEGSLVFGLASFAEGLDLPGDYLKHVIIAKLPFSVPDDPVEATYSEWLRSQGGNPFSQVVLPDAITRLMQACGRLLRSENDSGVISIFDRRLWRKSYGNTILAALPPFRREFRDLSAVSSATSQLS